MSHIHSLSPDPRAKIAVGTPSNAEAAAEGMSRCVSCDPHIYGLSDTADTIGTTCVPSVELGEAVRIGSANQFGVSESQAFGLAAIGDTLYMVGAGTDALYVLRYR